MAIRRLRKAPAALEVTAFINLIVVLVPFLLSTAVFTRLAVLELNLPAQNAGVEKLQVDKLQLELVLRADAVDVGDRIGGLIAHLPHTAEGPDVRALNALLHQVKAKFPDEKAATLLARPDTPYRTLVALMDATREGRTSRGTEVVKAELFPVISLGDAPQGK
ncbi:biopolymer transporter ExbD [Ideonella sp. 4Y11]|uniref:Biopolymer transporter ExbD n=1 Tax=Ideonella aquatica TaxID=2824119 RepID=A0A940YJM5_9BURK|nr:biopolymer transporter ExbD [Ideonella aquatica]MBQ0961473.1 biopolymer transporter ExbD [Ideonella aquatica]